MTQHLAAPTAEENEWELRASCRGLPTSTFYLPENVRGTEKQNHIDRAKRICRACWVQADCGKAGEHEEFGIWGGMTPRERRVAFDNPTNQTLYAREKRKLELMQKLLPKEES